MRQTKFTQEQVMFTLAMISYRGFQYLGEGRFSDERLRDAVDDALERLEPVKEQWELVWGPATYRAPFTLFADSAMYVVRNRKKPSRYVVAIRGTNPLSLFDWVFGDLLTGKVTPWRYGNSAAAPKAAISLSTSLGLSILQNLRSSPPSRGLLADIWRLVDRNLVDPLSEIARNVPERPATAVAETKTAPPVSAKASATALPTGALVVDVTFGPPVAIALTEAKPVTETPRAEAAASPARPLATIAPPPVLLESIDRRDAPLFRPSA